MDRQKKELLFSHICTLPFVSPGLIFLVASFGTFLSSASPCPLPSRIPAHYGWKSFPLSCWILSSGLFGTVWVVYLFQIKAPAFCLGLRVRVPGVLWNWTLLNTPGDSSELAHRFPGWQMHKAKGKGEVFISSLGPTVPLKSLWLAPSRIIPTAAGNPQAVFSPDKQPGQRKDLNMPSWERKDTKPTGPLSHVCATWRVVANTDALSRVPTLWALGGSGRSPFVLSQKFYGQLCSYLFKSRGIVHR